MDTSSFFRPFYFVFVRNSEGSGIPKELGEGGVCVLPGRPNFSASNGEIYAKEEEARMAKGHICWHKP